MAAGQNPSSPRATRTNSLIGRTIDDFEILEEIGRGGMGVVFRARQMSLDRFVAFKILSQALGLTEHAVGRFQREAKATAKLNHPNIVPIYAQGQQDQTYYYAMELVSGRSLYDMIKELRGDGAAQSDADASDVQVQLADSSTMATEIALAETRIMPRGADGGRRTNGKQGGGDAAPASGSSVVRSSAHDDPRFAGYTDEYFDEIALQIRDVADALEYAHREGVIHRDIKPHNLLVGRGGRLCLTDFGLARVLAQPGMTQTGEFVGSPLYMAPEQITGRGEVHGVAADIYSLGATLYEWLTLSPPFPAATREQVISQIITTDVLPSRSRNRRVPLDLETICAKALEKEPGRRYRSAADMRDDLDRFLRRSKIRAQRASVLTATARMLSRRRTTAIAAGALVIIAALTTLLVRERNNSRLERNGATPQRVDATPTLPSAVPPDAPEVSGATLSLAEKMKYLEDVSRTLGGDALLSGIFSTDSKEEYTPTTDQQRLGAAFVVAQREQEAARAALEDSTLGKPSLADEHYRRALQATTANAALESIAECLKLDAAHPDALLLRAWIRCQLAEPAEMLADAEALLAAKADDPDALMVRAAARLQLGEFPKAQADVAAAAEQLKEDYRIELLAGLIADSAEDVNRAIASYGRVLNLSPNNVLALMRRAQLDLRQGHPKSALADLNRVAAIEPGNAEAVGLRGECHDRLQDYGDAVASYKQAFEISGQLAWLTKWAAAALNAEQQGRAASGGEEPKQEEVDQDNLRRQDVVPTSPPAGDVGAVYHWWQNMLNRTREPQDSSGTFAPRTYARMPR